MCFFFIVIKCNVCIFDKENIKNIFFLCVLAYGQYSNIFWTFFLYKKNWKFWKMCFRMDFLNIKIIFLHFWILQHVCKTSKGVGQYSKKYKNLISWRNHLVLTINVWIKKSQRDEYPKYLMGITCYYSLLIFG
jgi:hypothetical protein